MRRNITIYWLGGVFVLGIMALPPDVFSSGNAGFAIETAQVHTEDQKAAEDAQIIRKKFEELDAENQEKARRLGYKEGDMVELRQESGGTFVILPPSQEIMTPEKMREKLLALVAEKIVRQLDENVSIQFMLAEDLAGNFTIRAHWNNLHQELRKEAIKLGYKKGDAIEVRVDATTWEYHVIPLKKENKFAGELFEIIPSNDPGGLPSYRFMAKFEALPEELQERAKTGGYGKNESVRFIYHEATKEYEILPPLLLIGLQNKWEKLTAQEQEKALNLGYKEGDIVWKTSDAEGKFKLPKKEFDILFLEIDGILQTVIDTKGIFELVPPSKVFSPPLFKATHLICLLDGQMKMSKNLLRCPAKLEDLSIVQQYKALGIGYKAKDEVVIYYNIETEQFEFILRPKK